MLSVAILAKLVTAREAESPLVIGKGTKANLAHTAIFLSCRGVDLRVLCQQISVKLKPNFLFEFLLVIIPLFFNFGLIPLEVPQYLDYHVAVGQTKDFIGLINDSRYLFIENLLKRIVFDMI